MKEFLIRGLWFFIGFWVGAVWILVDILTKNPVNKLNPFNDAIFIAFFARSSRCQLHLQPSRSQIFYTTLDILPHIDERAEKIMQKHREEIDKKFDQAQNEYDKNSNSALKRIEEQEEEIEKMKDDIERAKNDINGVFPIITQVYDTMNKNSPF